MKRFFKGIFKLRPARPKYVRTWNVDTVLDFMAKLFPLENLTFQQLSEKLIMLLALTTAHRVQTFSLIKLGNIYFTSNSVEISISELIKTSAPGRHQPLLVLPFFKEKPELCAANTLQFYITFTKTLRETQTLFLALKKPHRAVTSQTLSRWIKNTLQKSGIDVSTFTAHSTRHASTSAAFSRGVNLDQIRQTAGWTKKSQIFARFYNRPITTDSHRFAYSVLTKTT